MITARDAFVESNSEGDRVRSEVATAAAGRSTHTPQPSGFTRSYRRRAVLRPGSQSVTISCPRVGDMRLIWLSLAEVLSYHAVFGRANPS